MTRYNVVYDLHGDAKPFRTMFIAHHEDEARQLALEWLMSCPFEGAIVRITRAYRRRQY